METLNTSQKPKSDSKEIKKEELNKRISENAKKYRTDLRPIYTVFSRILEEVLRQATRELGIMAIVESRTKDVGSFIGKAFRKAEEHPEPAFTFTDLCGARVIVEYKDQLHKVCTYIRQHFDIDEANSKDPAAALGESTFTYRPLHLIVSMREEFLKEHKSTVETVIEELLRKTKDSEQRCLIKNANQHLCMQRSDNSALPQGPLYRAEIQVRTLLEHAWSILSHDRVYKGDLTLPQPLSRGLNRISAVLEETDEGFARIVNEVDSYNTYQGLYLTGEARDREIEKLELIRQECEPEGNDEINTRDAKRAHRIAQLTAAKEDWEKTVNTLAPIVEQWEKSKKGIDFLADCKNLWTAGIEPSVKRSAERRIAENPFPLMCAILLEYGWASWNTHKNHCYKIQEEARGYIRLATQLDLQSTEARVRLSKTYTNCCIEEELKWLTDAFRIAPSDPGVVGAYLYADLMVHPEMQRLPALRGSLEDAINTCQRWARVEICLPDAFFLSGFFLLMRDQGMHSFSQQTEMIAKPCLVNSLIAYAKACDLSETASRIKDEKNYMEKLRLRLVGPDNKRFPGAIWLDSLLTIEAVAKEWRKAHKDIESKAESLKKEAETLKKQTEKSLKDADDFVQMHGTTSSELQKLANNAKKKESVFRKKITNLLEKYRIERLTTAANIDPQLAAIDKKADIHKDAQVVIVVGACDVSQPNVGRMVEHYAPHLKAALENFKGIVISGGTDKGISQIVGSVQANGNVLRRISYLHENQHVKNQAMCKVEVNDETETGYEIHYLEGDGFTPHELIQAWADILVAGIDPANVRLLALGGGILTRFEICFSLSLGAKVGVLAQSGGAAQEVLDDPDWVMHKGLINLPNDPQTIKAFFLSGQPPMAIDTSDLSKIAKNKHTVNAKKRIEQKREPMDKDWDELDSFYRSSITDRICYWDTLLQSINMKIVKENDNYHDGERVTKFDPKEKKIMAEMEHGRWNCERLFKGQKYGKEKKGEEEHPDIVPWCILNEKSKTYDFEYVDQILDVSNYGYKIIRTHKTK